MPSLRKLRYRHNLFLPFMTDEKRQGAACRKGFRQICFLPLFCVSAILSKVWISTRQFFSTFLFWYFLFLEAVVKAALFVVGEVWAIQVVINPSLVYLRHLRLVWQSRRKSTRLPIAASPKGRLRTFPLPSLSSIGDFYMPASLRFLLSDCMACNQIFYFFIRICLFSVYLHFDAVSTVSHPLVVPVQAQR